MHGPTLTRASILEAAVKTKFVVIQAGLDHARQSHMWAFFPTKQSDGHSLSMGRLQDIGAAAFRRQIELNISVLYWEELRKWLFQNTCKCLYNLQSTTVLISFLQIQVLPLLKCLSSYKLIFKNSSLRSQILLYNVLRTREHSGSSIMPTTLEVWNVPFIKSPTHQPL